MTRERKHGYSGYTAGCRCGVCRAASKVYHNTHDKTPEGKASSRRAVTKYVARKREAVSALKAVPCMDCGKSYPPYVMDLDHVRGVKLGDVSSLVVSGTMESVLAEAAKCDVVCANCHRERTHSRRIAGQPQTDEA